MNPAISASDESYGQVITVVAPDRRPMITASFDILVLYKAKITIGPKLAPNPEKAYKTVSKIFFVGYHAIASETNGNNNNDILERITLCCVDKDVFSRG